MAVGGGVASGKSTVSAALAARLAVPRIEADRVRASLLNDSSDPVLHEAHWAHGLAPGFEDEVYAELFRRAAAVLDSASSLLLDACFPRARHRRAVRELALQRGYGFVFVECRADAATIRSRLAKRDSASGRTGWQQIHRDLARRWEPADELAPEEHIVLDTGQPPQATAALLAQRFPLGDARPETEADGSATARGSVPLPDVVTFDCWQTLLYEADWPTAHSLRVQALARAAAEGGRAVSVAEAARAFDGAWQRHMQLWSEGVATGAREIGVWALADLGLREPYLALEHLVRAHEEASHSSSVAALDGARVTLEVLSRARVPCALVCDTGLTPGRVVREHLERLGLLELLEVQIFSDEVGVPKPHPESFEAALRPLGAKPHRALHVGDLRRTDVAGARALGMRSVRITARHDDQSDLPEADFVVASHAELRSLLAL